MDTKAFETLDFSISPKNHVNPQNRPVMSDINRKAYQKVIAALSFLEDAQPMDHFYIGNESEGATVDIRGFNNQPENKIEVEIWRQVPNEVITDKDGELKTKKYGYRYAPRIVFELDKTAQMVNVFAIYDERPNRSCNSIISEKSSRLNAEGLNQKFLDYIKEFEDLGYIVQ